MAPIASPLSGATQCRSATMSNKAYVAPAAAKGRPDTRRELRAGSGERWLASGRRQNSSAAATRATYVAR